MIVRTNRTVFSRLRKSLLESLSACLGIALFCTVVCLTGLALMWLLMLHPVAFILGGILVLVVYKAIMDVFVDPIAVTDADDDDDGDTYDA